MKIIFAIIHSLLSRHYMIDLRLACGNELSLNAFNNHFIQLISAVIDKHAPLQRNPLTKGILTSIKQKQKLYRTHFK